MYDLYKADELIGRNCQGKGKPAISDDKQQVVCSFCREFYPSDMKASNAWRECQVAIDEMLRRCNRKKPCYTTAMLKK